MAVLVCDERQVVSASQIFTKETEKAISGTSAAIFKRMEADDPDGDVQIVPTRSETIRRLKP